MNTDQLHAEITRLTSELAALREERAQSIIERERLSTCLETALRQWRSYAEERGDDEEDMDKATHWEAVVYREGVRQAKGWRDKAAALAADVKHPSGSPEDLHPPQEP